MSTPKTIQIAAIYDFRSAQYDQSFHPRQAADFIKWAQLKPGQHVLDLCCGTGLVTLLAKEAVGPSGKVIGVDISVKMMNEGRRKAADSGLEVEFKYGDVARIAREELLSSEMEGFDLITCASGIVLLDDPDAALKYWGTLLTPGGKVIFDVPVEDALLGGAVLREVLQEAGLPSELVYSQKWVTSLESLKEAVSTSGLEPASVFETGSYCTTECDASETLGHFEKLIKYSNAGESADPALRAKMKDEFEVRMRERADASGKISESVRFFIAVASRSA